MAWTNAKESNGRIIKMRYYKFLQLLARYADCIDCEVFIENGVLVIVSQGIKIDEIKEDE
jgi:hypothetical protein